MHFLVACHCLGQDSAPPNVWGRNWRVRYRLRVVIGDARFILTNVIILISRYSYLSLSLYIYIYIHLSSPYVYRHSNNRFILQLVLFRSKSTTFLFFNFGSLSFSAPWNFNPFEFTTRCFVLKLGEQWIELAAGTPLTCQPATDVLQWVVSHWSFCHVFLFDSEEEQW